MRGHQVAKTLLDNADPLVRKSIGRCIVKIEKLFCRWKTEAHLMGDFDGKKY